MAITAPNHSYNHQESTLRTICRIAPGAIIWLNLIVLFFLAFYDGRLFFIFTAPFFIFNAYLLTHVGIYSRQGLTLMHESDKKDFYREYIEQKRKLEDSGFSVINWEDVIHYVIVPNYKEDVNTLSETLGSMAESKYAKQIVIVLAMEQREKEAQALQKYSADEARNKTHAIANMTPQQPRKRKTTKENSTMLYFCQNKRLKVCWQLCVGVGMLSGNSIEW